MHAPIVQTAHQQHPVGEMTSLSSGEEVNAWELPFLKMRVVCIDDLLLDALLALLERRESEVLPHTLMASSVWDVSGQEDDKFVM